MKYDTSPSRGLEYKGKHHRKMHFYFICNKCYNKNKPIWNSPKYLGKLEGRLELSQDWWTCIFYSWYFVLFSFQRLHVYEKQGPYSSLHRENSHQNTLCFDEDFCFICPEIRWVYIKYRGAIWWMEGGVELEHEIDPDPLCLILEKQDLRWWGAVLERNPMWERHRRTHSSSRAKYCVPKNSLSPPCQQSFSQNG